MKKSDLSWTLPLLQAWHEGKIIQIYAGRWVSVYGKEVHRWTDWEKEIAPDFSAGKENYRIKPKLKLPVEVYGRAAYPDHSGVWSRTLHKQMETGVAAVLVAYWAGELDLTGLE